MSEQSVRGPAFLAPVARAWQRVSPRLVPLLAVLTAFIFGIPFILFTTMTSGATAGEGLRVAGLAYSALIEGSTGLVINDLVSADDVALVTQYTDVHAVSSDDLNALDDAGELAVIGEANARRYGEVLARYDLPAEELDELGQRIADITRIGADTLDAMRPLVTDLLLLERSQVRELGETYGVLDELSAEDREALEALAPAAADISDADLLAYMAVVNEEGIVRLERLLGQLDVLADLGLSPDDADAQDIGAIAAIGAETALELAQIQANLDDAAITDPALFAEQVTLVRRMYDADLLTDPDVGTALATEFDTAVAENLVVRRAGNRILVDYGAAALFGVQYSDNNTPDDPTDDRPENVYLRLGGSALLFFPSNLEQMIVRAIPFVIAGLAVALGFKAGLFNIGAEGQLYIAAVFAVFVGYSDIFAGLPALVHLPLVLIAGVIGGLLWGSIPGILKAYTGAHEVINTIMLNFVAILTVNWLIKSTDPVIMQDTSASIPRTPFIAESARLPIFSQIATFWFVLAGVLTLAVGLYFVRRQMAQNWRYAIRPVVYGLLVTFGGLFLAWIAVRDNLHLGLVIMVLLVWFTGWFLDRTTLGFELRTVGANPDAARYAGMSVPWNIILAMGLSGAIAGVAGTIQVSGVQHNLQPEFFAGLGFDAIAVALLARTNPRNMIFAGLLWGSLLTGAPLMQVNANISIDLVKIVQALIIMFIAADMIIRYLWRVPEASEEEKSAAVFSKGWGG